MIESDRTTIIKIASEAGLNVDLKDDGQDIYNKLITLSDTKENKLYIDKVTGVSKNGEIQYLKIAVHPSVYKSEIEDNSIGIIPAINRITGKNQHSHSGYKGFPNTIDNNEPVGAAYKVKDLDALKVLLSGYGSRITHTSETVVKGKVVESDTTKVLVNVSELSTAALPDKGLIIDEPWISKILSGEKVWEMRSTNCKIRGEIGLIKKGSGTVVAKATLVDSIGPFSRQELKEQQSKHAINSFEIDDDRWMDKWNYAWVLEDVQKLSNPVKYKHKSGAVIWVTL